MIGAQPDAGNGEVCGEGEEGMRAVGRVILNRLRRAWRGAATAAEICRACKQSSRWHEGDPNRRTLERIAHAPDVACHQAELIARQMVARSLADITFKATHCAAASLSPRPSWLDGQEPCVAIGRHEFYNDIH